MAEAGGLAACRVDTEQRGALAPGPQRHDVVRKGRRDGAARLEQPGQMPRCGRPPLPRLRFREQDGYRKRGVELPVEPCDQPYGQQGVTTGHEEVVVRADGRDAEQVLEDPGHGGLYRVGRRRADSARRRDRGPGAVGPDE